MYRNGVGQTDKWTEALKNQVSTRVFAVHFGKLKFSKLDVKLAQALKPRVNPNR